MSDKNLESHAPVESPGIKVNKEKTNNSKIENAHDADIEFCFN